MLYYGDRTELPYYEQTPIKPMGKRLHNLPLYLK